MSPENTATMPWPRESTMPQVLALLRHGESEGQVAVALEKRGDSSAFTPEFRNTSSAEWNLTRKGIWQARHAAVWLDRFVLGTTFMPESAFDKAYFSTHRRARQTMGALLLKGIVANAMVENEPVDELYQASYDVRLRELDFGDVSTIPRKEYEEQYPGSVWTRKVDPVFGRTPGGESLADVMDRSRSFFGTLSRAHARGIRSVVAATHGRQIRSMQLNLEGVDPLLDWQAYDRNPVNEIKNCTTVIYSRRNPETGVEVPTYRWAAVACPWEAPDEPPRWREISTTTTMTAEDCLRGIPQEWLNDPL